MLKSLRSKPNTKTMRTPGWRMVIPHLREGRVVVGIDEVGRGSWAGPVTAAAVILPPRLRLAGANDSKLLTPTDRLRLDRRIRRSAIAIGIGWASAAEVDANGLGWAVKRCGLRALEDMAAAFDVVILDGKHNYLREEEGYASEVYVKADQRVVSVAAASIVAKVARDRYMERLGLIYPAYGMPNHKGYPTPEHTAALRDYGPCVEHRISWRPFADAVVGEPMVFGEFAPEFEDDRWV